ncbi:uncharacterized protein LOC129592768 [Paramacrobiotus metropolitanus]|uniref:uncharacterized protein LOC129592768 n=1 Tax=Paramacrobiotus metropolitanus TaxID=2943436 RepID=UPI002445E751|nr:uncharacterized protein LOC129592768 [Paramacrobiotus metropolitanus]
MTASKAPRSFDKFPIAKLFLIIGGIGVAATAVNAVITLICQLHGPSALAFAGTPISASLSVALLVLAVHFQLKLPFRSRKCYNHMDGTDLLVIRCLLALLSSIGLLLVLRTITIMVPLGNQRSLFESTLQMTAIMTKTRNDLLGNETRAHLTSEEYNQIEAAWNGFEGTFNAFRDTVAKAEQSWGASMRPVILVFFGLIGLLFLFQSIVGGVLWTRWASFREESNKIAADSDEEKGKTLDNRPSTELGSAVEKCAECSAETGPPIVVIHAYKGALALYMMFILYYLINF